MTLEAMNVNGVGDNTAAVKAKKEQPAADTMGNQAMLRMAQSLSEVWSIEIVAFDVIALLNTSDDVRRHLKKQQRC